MSRLSRLCLLVGLVIAAIVQPTPVSACPNCKEAVAAQPSESGGMASGYNWSILFMIATPFTLLGTGAFLVKRAADRGMFPEL